LRKPFGRQFKQLMTNFLQNIRHQTTQYLKYDWNLQKYGIQHATLTAFPSQSSGFFTKQPWRHQR
jgi:hypothetical protein